MVCSRLLIWSLSIDVVAAVDTEPPEDIALGRFIGFSHALGVTTWIYFVLTRLSMYGSLCSCTESSVLYLLRTVSGNCAMALSRFRLLQISSILALPS